MPLKWGSDKTGIRFDSPFSAELFDLLSFGRNPLAIFEQQLTPPMLALWILDDGYRDNNRLRYTVSVKRQKNSNYLELLANLLFYKYGLKSRVRAREGALIFDRQSSAKKAGTIAQFVPPCMERKLPEELRGRYIGSKLAPSPNFLKYWTSVIEVRDGSQNRGFSCYGVTIKNNHNFLVGNACNGVIIHDV